MSALGSRFDQQLVKVESCCQNNYLPGLAQARGMKWFIPVILATGSRLKLYPFGNGVESQGNRLFEIDNPMPAGWRIA